MDSNIPGMSDGIFRWMAVGMTSAGKTGRIDLMEGRRPMRVAPERRGRAMAMVELERYPANDMIRMTTIELFGIASEKFSGSGNEQGVG